MANWKERIKKLSYYRDPFLFFQIFLFSFKLSLSLNNNLIRLANPPGKDRPQEREKIVKYINLCLRLRRFLGFKDTCLTSSLLLCNFLRRSGIDAQVNFAASPTQPGKIFGHCWVNLPDQRPLEEWQTLFKYPLPANDCKE